jgi:hypothetical protein
MSTAKEIYDMVMINAALELLDRMPDVSHKPILIAEPPPSPPVRLVKKVTPVIPTPTKTLGPRLPKPKIPRPPALSKEAKAAAKEEAKAHKAALKAAQAAAKAAEKEAARLRKALAKLTAAPKKA